jgi:hypothetical protein
MLMLDTMLLRRRILARREREHPSRDREGAEQLGFKARFLTPTAPLPHGHGSDWNNKTNRINGK